MAVRMVLIILALLAAMWVVWKVFLNVEPAPPPEVKVARAVVPQSDHAG